MLPAGAHMDAALAACCPARERHYLPAQEDGPELLAHSSHTVTINLLAAETGSVGTLLQLAAIADPHSSSCVGHLSPCDAHKQRPWRPGTPAVLRTNLTAEPHLTSSSCGTGPERSRLRPLESCRKDTSPTTSVTGRPRPKAYLQTHQGQVTVLQSPPHFGCCRFCRWEIAQCRRSKAPSNAGVWVGRGTGLKEQLQPGCFIAGRRGRGYPAAELRTPSIPLAPLLAVVGTPGSTGTAEPPPMGDAPVLEGRGSLGSPSASSGGFRGEAAYMSMSRMGMLLPRKSAMPAHNPGQSLKLRLWPE